MEGRVRPLAGIDAATCRELVGIFCDIDDTVTLHGKIVPEAFLALKQAQEAGLVVVPVTGRPAGWVDHIARMWPVDGVVGENGGLWFWHDGTKLQRRFLQDDATRAANRERLKALREVILTEVAGAGVASDQPYRELDLAIDFCEDVPHLDEAAVDRIVALFRAHGATAKVSSIHVNGWYGDFDKRAGCERFVWDRWGRVLGDELDKWAFFGDSGNDEPMFARFPVSIGVANVRDFLGRMTDLPKWICEKDGGYGLAEGIAVLLSRR